MRQDERDSERKKERKRVDRRNVCARDADLLIVLSS